MANAKPTGYELSRAWFDFAFENNSKVTASHTALYLWLIEINNRLGWCKEFQITAKECMQGMACKSHNTYKKCLDDLISFGFIELKRRSTNQYQTNIIALSKNDKAQYKALDKALSKHYTEQQESTHQSTIQSIDSIHKPQTINREREDYKPFFEIADFENDGYTFGLSEKVTTTFDQFLKYRFERKEPVVSGVVIEKMLKDMWIRSRKDEDMIRMIDYTIAKSAKNIITDCDLSAKTETESEKEERIRKNWDTPIGTHDKLFGE